MIASCAASSASVGDAPARYLDRDTTDCQMSGMAARMSSRMSSWRFWGLVAGPDSSPATR